MKTSRYNSVVISIVLLLLSYILVIAKDVENKNAIQEEQQQEFEYRIAANDLLEISVYEEPDLSKTVRVTTGGTIAYPLLGNISVVELTAKELETKLMELLEKDYLVNPQVNVFIKEFSKISILGQVKKPGSYEMTGGLKLTQVIAIAGGFTDTANTSKVKLIRTSNNKNKETIEIDFEQVLNKSIPDIEIKPNDTIMVEEYGKISIVGEVAKPGVYDLKKGLTVIEAVALAGGLNDTAAGNNTKVIRKQDGKKKVIRIPLVSIFRSGDKSKDIILEPDDTIVVPESVF